MQYHSGPERSALLTKSSILSKIISCIGLWMYSASRDQILISSSRVEQMQTIDIVTGLVMFRPSLRVWGKKRNEKKTLCVCLQCMQTALIFNNTIMVHLSGSF